MRPATAKPRRILVCSYDFHPRIGGTETAGMTLATGLAERGYEVTVLSATPDAAGDAVFPFRVVRRPGARQMLRLFRETDLVWHNQVSLRLWWPVLLAPRPVVFVHHSPLVTDTGPGPRFGNLKRVVCSRGHNAFVSEAYREAAGLCGPVIYNAYDESNFHPWPDVPRDRDVVFLGRLVREKGADLLIEALALLAGNGTPLRATIIGSGAQEAELKSQVARLGLGPSVEFAGAMRGEALSRMLARHQMMAMPSRWFEGLPISAIEGLACGCVVIGSDSGGLPEAIGPCGPITPRNVPEDLAAALRDLAGDRARLEAHRARIPQHLGRFSKAALMDRCEHLILAAVNKATAGRA